MIHRTKAGDVLYLEGMTDLHLENSIRFFLRPVKGLIEEALAEKKPKSKRAKMLYSRAEEEVTPEDFRERIDRAYLTIGPYVVEAVIRGLNVTKILQDAFGRTSRDEEAPASADGSLLTVKNLLQNLLDPDDFDEEYGQ